MNLLVLGASGFLGRNLLNDWRGVSEITVRGYARNLQSFTQDLIDNVTVHPFDQLNDDLHHFSSFQTVVINCVALADLSLCDHQPEKARQTNAQFAGDLAERCKQKKIPLIHISTDGLFSKETSSPHYWKKEEPPAPITIYGVSKWQGEQLLAREDWGSVVRTSFVGPSQQTKRGLLYFLAESISLGRPLIGFEDIWFTPLHTSQLSHQLIGLALTFPTNYRLLHWGTYPALTKYEFLKAVLEKANIPYPVQKAKRAQIGGLSVPLDQSLTSDTEIHVKNLIDLSAETLLREITLLKQKSST